MFSLWHQVLVAISQRNSKLCISYYLIIQLNCHIMKSYHYFQGNVTNVPLTNCPPILVQPNDATMCHQYSGSNCSTLYQYHIILLHHANILLYPSCCASLHHFYLYPGANTHIKQLNEALLLCKIFLWFSIFFCK